MESPRSRDTPNSVSTERRTRTRGRRRRRGNHSKRKARRGIGIRNHTPKKEAESILRERTRRSSRRHKKGTRTRRERERVRSRYTQRALTGQRSSSGREPTKSERARKRTSLRLRLSPKLRKKGQVHVTSRKGDHRRHCVKLAGPASCRQSQQIEDLPNELPKRTGRERLRGRTTEKRKNTGQIPRRNTKRGDRALQAERAEKVPKNKVRKAQGGQNGIHRSTWSGKKLWRRKRETRYGEDREEKT